MSQTSPKHIALSGQIASGKSSLLQEFKKAGWLCLSADEIVHEIYQKNFLQLDELRKKARSSTRELKKLEKFVHPKVRDSIFKSLRAKPHKRIVVEIPLLFEGGLYKRFRTNIFVYAPSKIRKERASDRGMDSSLFERLESQQWPAVDKATFSDFVIHNAGKVSDFRKSAKELIEFLS